MAVDARELVAQVLSNAGVGTIINPTADWAIHCTATPPEIPDNCIILRRYGGLQSHPTRLLDYPFVQVMVRGNENNERAAVAKLLEAKAALLGLEPQVVLGDRIDGIIQIEEVFDLPRDGSNRPRSTYVVQLFVEPASDGGNRQPL